jgi:hypothetical protein
MAAVLADLRELTRPLPAFAAFQLGHFLPSRFQLFIEKDNASACETIGNTDLILIRAAHLMGM